MTLVARLRPYTFWRLDKPGCRYRTREDRLALRDWLGLERIPG